MTNSDKRYNPPPQTVDPALQLEIDTLNAQAWDLRSTDWVKAHNLSQKAYDLSKTGKFALEPYHYGITASLVTISSIHREIGNMEIATTRCMEALSHLEFLPPCDVTVDVWVDASWIYIYTGNYSKALEYTKKAVDLAGALDSKSRQATALDTMAAIYSAAEQYEDAVKFHKKALTLFTKSGSIRGKVICLNNSADTLYEMGNYQEALKYGKKSLTLARNHSLKNQALLAVATLSQILMKMGKYRLAETQIRTALQTVELENPNIYRTYLQVQLGEVLLQRGKLPEAEIQLHKTVRDARSIQAFPELAEAHQLLAELYEKKSAFDKALQHHKEFHATLERVKGGEAIKKVEVLRVVEQLDTAQKEAELERRRAEKLQNTIRKQKREQKKLKKLVITDSLTTLFNRRHIQELVNQECVQAGKSGAPITLMLLDIDNFKNINDQFGHGAGDLVLTSLGTTIKGCIRSQDKAGRLGGDEFMILLPNTNVHPGSITARRIFLSIHDQTLDFNGNKLSFTVSIGVAGISKPQILKSAVFETLYTEADKALYRAKRMGRNQIAVLQVDG